MSLDRFMREVATLGAGLPEPELVVRPKRRMPAVQGRDLYVIACIVTCRCKLGRANDVWQRFDAIQSCSPTRLVVYVHAPGLGWLEEVLHQAFADDRLHGEWFGSSTMARIASRVQPGAVDSFARYVAATRKQWIRRSQR